ncbi:MAG: hypothetical protein WDO68_22280 [Gammaproteobacteria bacterium]
MRDQEPVNGHKSSGRNGDARARRSAVAADVARRVRVRAFEGLSPGKRTTSNLYLDRNIVPKGARLGPSFESYVVDRDSVLVFADHAPRANFAHSCSYWLYDASTGEPLRRIAARFPPHPLEGIHLMELFHQPVRPMPRLQPRIATGAGKQRTMMESAGAGRRYAILFAGDANPHHLNDMELSLRTLMDTFHFARTDIFILFHDGTDSGSPYRDPDGKLRKWPGSTTEPDFRLKPDKKGSIKDLRIILGGLTLGTDDLLFMQVEGHGGIDYLPEGGRAAFISAVPDGPTSPEKYFASDMGADLQGLHSHASLLALMNQCFAGGFRASVLAGSKASRTFLACACAEDETASTTEDEQWNEFSLNWIEAQKQHPVDASQYMPRTDIDLDGNVEASEAYNFCVYVNQLIKGEDTPVSARLPAPDAQDHSAADQISLA